MQDKSAYPAFEHHRVTQSDDAATQAIRARIREILLQYPTLLVRDVAADLLRDKTPDDPWERPVIAQALEATGGDPEMAWAFVKEHDPATAEAIQSALLAPDYMDVAREILGGGS